MKFIVFLIATMLISGGPNTQEILEVGQPAPEISLPTPVGDTVKLSSLKGKLVLVDFWATWCAPCVKEQPELKTLYEQYNDGAATGRFEIFGVSLDKSRDNWIKAIDRLDINWIQVSDLMFWKSPVATDYTIQELPFNVLVGEQGDIVAIDLHGEELNDFIAAYFDNN